MWTFYKISPTEKQKNVLNAFKAGKHLTVLSAIKLCGTTELRKIVCRLEGKGFKIGRYCKNGERFYQYYLK